MTRVSGETSELGIANAFREHFKRVYTANDAPAHESLKRTFLEKFCLSWPDMLDVMACVNVGKSNASTIKPQHMLHGSEKLVYHLHLLF